MTPDQIIETIRNANTALTRKDHLCPDQLRIFHNLKRKAIKEFKEKTKPLPRNYELPPNLPHLGEAPRGQKISSS